MLLIPSLGKFVDYIAFGKVYWWRVFCVCRTATTNAVDDKIDAIELRMGSASNLELIQTISTQPIPLALGKFDWVPYENLTTATSYVLLAKNSQGISYSGKSNEHYVGERRILNDDD